MKAIKITLAIGIVLVSTSPAFTHFVKAALGFRLGYSPTEQGYGKKGYHLSDKKGIGVQVHSGVNNNGGWQGQGGGLQAAGSGYGVGIGGGGGGQGRSYGGGPLDAHVGHGAVKHLRILGLNLYLGGRAAHGLHGGGGGFKPPLAKKPIYNLYHQHQHHHQPSYLGALGKPISLGASVGTKLNPVVQHAPNGGKVIGGAGGIRAAVGTPGYGLGFNLGYKQGINTKSPLGYIFGLGGHGQHKHYSPIHKGPIYKGQDQVFIPGGGILKGHGHDLGHSNGIGGQNGYFGAFSGLESKQHLNTQPLPAASNTQQQQQQQQQHQTQQQPQYQNQQQQPQASHQQHQQAQAPAKHQGLQGPLALPSSYPRNPFLALFQGRPSILRPTPYQYTFNNPQSLSSGPVRMMLPHHPPTPAPQRPHSASPNNVSPPSWSTLFSMGGPQHAPTNNFINPLPPNGQPLAKLQATLRPGNQFHHQAASPVQSAQNQVPFIQQGSYQPQQQYQNYFPQALQSQANFGQQQQQPLHHQPQNNFQQYFNHGFNQQQQQQHQPTAAPQQDFQSLFHQQNPLQSFQQFPQANFQQSNLLPQQSPFFNQIQEQPIQAAAQAKQSENFSNLSDLPFNAESMPFAPEAGYQFSHSTVSEPVKMGDYTLHMDLGSNGGVNNAGDANSPAGSDVPMFGPMGRRLKKAKKPRQDVIIKKQGSVSTNDVIEEVSASTNKPVKSHNDMMEASASTNTITLASSLGSTSWTPMKIVDPPKLEKKSLETPVAATVQVINKKQPQEKQVQPQLQLQRISSPTGGSAILTGPSPALGPQEHKQERTMILKKRRLNLSSDEMLNAPTVIPAMMTTTTESLPSSTTTSTTTTTTTTTVVPPSSSSSSAPSSPSSSASPSVPETTSQSSEPTTTTVVST